MDKHSVCGGERLVVVRNRDRVRSARGSLAGTHLTGRNHAPWFARCLPPPSNAHSQVISQRLRSIRSLATGAGGSAVGGEGSLDGAALLEYEIDREDCVGNSAESGPKTHNLRYGQIPSRHEQDHGSETARRSGRAFHLVCSAPARGLKWPGFRRLPIDAQNPTTPPCHAPESVDRLDPTG